MYKIPYFAVAKVYGKSIHSSSLYSYDQYLFFEHLDNEADCIDLIINMHKENKEVVKIDISVFPAVSYYVDGNIEARGSVLKLARTHYYNR